MFIAVKDKKSEVTVINSNIIYNISLFAELSKPNSAGINNIIFRIHIEDFEGNIYRTKKYSCANEINIELDNIKELIVTTIEVVLNSGEGISKSFINEVGDRVSSKLTLFRKKR